VRRARPSASILAGREHHASHHDRTARPRPDRVGWLCSLPVLAHFSTEISHVPSPLLCRADIEFSLGTQWARNCA
jgi:hypothetical protein